MEPAPVHFKQLMIDCAREGSFGKLDNRTIAKRPSPQPSGNFRKSQCCKGPYKMCVVALGISSFMQKASDIKNPQACGETVANDPGPWILKRGTGNHSS